MAAAAVLTVAGVAAAQPEPVLRTDVSVQRFYGYAYGRDSHEYLYTEIRTLRYDAQGKWLGGSVRYYWPNGRLIGRKVFSFDPDPFLPVYDLELTDESYREGITKITPEGVFIFKKNHTGTVVHTKVLGRESPQASDAGVAALVAAHMDELQDGKSIYFDLVVPGQLDDYHVMIKKLSDTTFDGQSASILKMKFASLLTLVADPFFVTFTRSGKLLEFKGLSNVLNPTTGKVYNVDVLYTQNPPKDAPTPLPPLE